MIEKASWTLSSICKRRTMNDSQVFYNTFFLASYPSPRYPLLPYIFPRTLESIKVMRKSVEVLLLPTLYLRTERSSLCIRYVSIRNLQITSYGLYRHFCHISLGTAPLMKKIRSWRLEKENVILAWQGRRSENNPN